MARSLQNSSFEKIISDLGEVADKMECLFSCGGTVDKDGDSNVLISYKTKTGEWSSQPLQLPGSTDIQDLIDSCSVASFGLGSRTVTDKNYRDALKLEPDSFMTNFNISNTPLINDITNLMTITSPFRAELYKLNIYSVGGHFKSHVDTPRSGNMFGSLVVCLPFPFTGGELVTRHRGRQVTFNWTTKSDAIQWAAFYSNVEHEVLPVTSGNRITLTYNLYWQRDLPMLPISVDITANPFYCSLSSALHTPHFMRDGGILGFLCSHKYVDMHEKRPVLKGEDAIIYQTAKTLGLAVEIRPLMQESFCCDMRCDRQFILDKFHHFCYKDEEHYDQDYIIPIIFRKAVVDDGQITWCQAQDDCIWEPAGSCMRYGNEAVVAMFYQAASILIVIPEFTSKRGSLGLTTPSLQTMLDNINIDD